MPHPPPPHLIRPQPQRQLRLGKYLVQGAYELHGQQLLPAVVAGLDDHAAQVPAGAPVGAGGREGGEGWEEGRAGWGRGLQMCGAGLHGGRLRNSRAAWVCCRLPVGSVNSPQGSVAAGQGVAGERAHLPCGDAACTRALRAAQGSPYTALAASCCCCASMLAGPAAPLACLSESASRPAATGLELPLAGSHTGMQDGTGALPTDAAASGAAPPTCWAAAAAGGGACCGGSRCGSGAASGVGSSGAGSLCCFATLRIASSEGMRWWRAAGLRTVRSVGPEGAQAGNAWGHQLLW